MGKSMQWAINNLRRALVKSGLAEPHEIRGCSADEISSLEKRLNLKLPDAYVAFLATMGHGAGRFLRGTEALYGHVEVIREWAEELLTETSSTYTLPEDSVVFLMHQGYTFLFFRTSEGDDPPVYLVQESKPVPELVSPSLSKLLFNSIEVDSQLMLPVSRRREARENALKWSQHRDRSKKHGRKIP
jgi:hypothetical protein